MKKFNSTLLTIIASLILFGSILFLCYQIWDIVITDQIQTDTIFKNLQILLPVLFVCLCITTALLLSNPATTHIHRATLEEDNKGIDNFSSQIFNLDTTLHKSETGLYSESQKKSVIADKNLNNKMVKNDLLIHEAGLQSNNDDKIEKNTLGEKSQTQVFPVALDKKYRKEARLEDTFENRLFQEVKYANIHEFDLSLTLIAYKYNNSFDETIEDKIREAIGKYMKETSFIYQLQDNEFAIILPFSDYQEAQSQIVLLYRSVKEEFEKHSIILSAGFSSRFSRTIESDVLYKEAFMALNKALSKKTFSILGFEPDTSRNI